MVNWRGRRRSDNVEDRRGAAGAAGASGIIILLLRFVVGRFGFRGILLLGLIGAGLYMAGVNPVALIQGGPVSQGPVEPIDDETLEFVETVTAETEAVWGRIFAEEGLQYVPPKVVMFTSNVSSGCGYASAQMGPFYCPADQKVYFDPNFFTELARRFGAPGDFAAVYVIAHEVGHHIQTITGISAQVRQAQSRASKIEQNQLQVRMELQADCYAGVFANRAERSSDFLNDDDLEEGLRAAAAIGDDTLQRQAGQRVREEHFTHGSSEQRVRWFRQGFSTGDEDTCDTFNISADRL
ncbi:MAG: neutral zinc metallopeptidase [Pseudomonadota bacterium]